MEKYKLIQTSDNKSIHVFDDVFDVKDRTRFYKFCSGSLFKITGGAGGEIEDQQDLFFQSMYNEVDVGNMGFEKAEGFKKLLKVLQNHRPIRAYTLVGNYSNQPHFHVDGSDLSLLYYVNNFWKADWGGETSFTNRDMNEIEYTSMYTPNRVVIFDSSIPHKPNVATIKATLFRFTFVMNFSKN